MFVTEKVNPSLWASEIKAGKVLILSIIISFSSISFHFFPSLSLSLIFFLLSHSFPFNFSFFYIVELWHKSHLPHFLFVLKCKWMRHTDSGSQIIHPQRQRCSQKSNSNSNIYLPPCRKTEDLSDRNFDSWGLNSVDIKIIST